jgi:hypothetical protein
MSRSFRKSFAGSSSHSQSGSSKWARRQRRLEMHRLRQAYKQYGEERFRQILKLTYAYRRHGWWDTTYVLHRTYTHPHWMRK